MDSLYREVEISWEPAILGRKSVPQAVKITTHGFFTEFYPRLIDWDWELYFQDKSAFYDRIPTPLQGRLDYKKPIDYMKVYYFRPGMEACVSESVKKHFESLDVDRDQYRLIPIDLGVSSSDFYVLFYPFTSLFEESDVKWSKCIFTDRFSYEEIVFRGKDDFISNLLNHQKDVRAKRIVLPSKYRSYDVINMWHSGRCFLSERLASSLSTIKGVEIVTPDRKTFCELVFED